MRFLNGVITLLALAYSATLAVAECPDATTISITSMDRTLLYTTLAQPTQLTLTGCNLVPPAPALGDSSQTNGSAAAASGNSAHNGRSVSGTLLPVSADPVTVTVTVGGITCTPIVAFSTPTTNAAAATADADAAAAGAAGAAVAAGVESTFVCTLPAGPLKPTSTAASVFNSATGALLFTEREAVTFHTPVFSHILPRVVANAGCSLRLGLSGLVRATDPMLRYAVTLAGLEASLQVVGEYYLTVKAAKLPEGQEEAIGAVVVVDTIYNETIIDTDAKRSPYLADVADSTGSGSGADESVDGVNGGYAIAIRRLTQYISAVTPNWAFAKLADPVRIELAVKEIATVVSVTVSGLPCTDVQRPNLFTVTCLLSECPEDGDCVGPKPEGIVLKYKEEETPTGLSLNAREDDDDVKTVTFYFQYIRTPILRAEAPLFPSASFPGNYAHRVTVHFEENSLDASVPMKLYVGDQSICSCALVYPWALHFLLDPTSYEGNLPLSIMLSDGLTRGYDIAGGITFEPPAPAPAVTLLKPNTIAPQADNLDSTVIDIVGYGYADVPRLTHKSTSEPCGTGGLTSSTPATVGSTTVVRFGIPRLRVMSRDGNVLLLKDAPLTAVPGPFGAARPVLTNGTLVHVAHCTTTPSGCVPGAYAVRGYDAKDNVVTTPAAGGCTGADVVTVATADSPSARVAVRIAAVYSDAARDAGKDAFWAAVDAATAPGAAGERFNLRIVNQGLSAASKSESYLHLIVTGGSSRNSKAKTAAAAASKDDDDEDEDTPAKELAEDFMKTFFKPDDAIPKALGRVVRYSISAATLCSDGEFRARCTPASGLASWQIALICVGAALAALALAWGLYFCCCRKKIANVAINDTNNHSVYRSIPEY